MGAPEAAWHANSGLFIAGAVLSANGVVINPSAVTVAPSGTVLGSVGLDISPTLITVGAVDWARAALGFSIAPSLIKVRSDSLSVHAGVR